MSSSQAKITQSGDQQNTEDTEEQQATRVPRRTPMACLFCRGRKLKCDGRSTCANCSRRNLPCTYASVSSQQS
ncbi:hypothetical protein JAAARDRAFT_195212 [Jaapia argillacea MUCL 33604]|uniref:Zn(2)-C6 fungal-type domain-containing protein n=1 Tax=Jaapia argillacea MUCL 33604 TaxID=933084 RepID=A0A067PMG4_9AGAM|nr:hypothetical protein JAAARDRAFT_195212 [Jaapia argillacea MUCL 33604]